MGDQPNGPHSPAAPNADVKNRGVQHSIRLRNCFVCGSMLAKDIARAIGIDPPDAWYTLIKRRYPKPLTILSGGRPRPGTGLTRRATRSARRTCTPRPDPDIHDR
jgi:hypothetical protein